MGLGAKFGREVSEKRQNLNYNFCLLVWLLLRIGLLGCACSIIFRTGPIFCNTAKKLKTTKKTQILGPRLAEGPDGRGGQVWGAGVEIGAVHKRANRSLIGANRALIGA